MKTSTSGLQVASFLMLALAVALPVAWNYYFFNVITPAVPKADRELGWAMALGYGNLIALSGTVLFSLCCSLANVYFIRSKRVMNKTYSYVLVWLGAIVSLLAGLPIIGVYAGW